MEFFVRMSPSNRLGKYSLWASTWVNTLRMDLPGSLSKMKDKGSIQNLLSRKFGLCRWYVQIYLMCEWTKTIWERWRWFSRHSALLLSEKSNKSSLIAFRRDHACLSKQTHFKISFWKCKNRIYMTAGAWYKYKCGRNEEGYSKKEEPNRKIRQFYKPEKGLLIRKAFKEKQI